MGSKERIKRRDAKRRLQKKEKIKGTFKKWLLHLIIAIVWTVIVVYSVVVIKLPIGNDQNLIKVEGAVIDKFFHEPWNTHRSIGFTCYVLDDDNEKGYYVTHPWKIQNTRDLHISLNDAKENGKHVEIYYDEQEDDDKVIRIYELYIDGELYLSRNETNTANIVVWLIMLIVHSFVVTPYLVVMWWKLYNKTPPFELNYYFGR